MLSAIPLAVLLAAPARAQDMDTFAPSGAMLDGQGTLQLHHPHLGLPRSYYLGATFSMADDPVVMLLPDGTESPYVSRQIAAHLLGGYNWRGLARLDVDLPLYPVVTIDPIGADESSAFALGDLSLSATVPLLRYNTVGVGAALTPLLRLPTGDPTRFTAAGGVSGGLVASLGGHGERLSWTTNLGADFLPPSPVSDELELGSHLDYGAGLRLPLPGSTAVGAELTGRMALSRVAAGSFWSASPLEGHLYGAFGQGGLTTTLGLGTGIIAGVGSPDYRIFAALSYSGGGMPSDRDGDGIPNEADACPDEPEDNDGAADGDGCPEKDTDGDGLVDGRDSCPEAPEDLDGVEDGDGCPDPDNDGDGLADGQDGCPNEAEDPDEHEDEDGCPDEDDDGDSIADLDDDCPQEFGPLDAQGCPDGDADRVPDHRDRCPEQPIDSRADPARSDGCPSRVMFTRTQLYITEKIYFESGSAVIERRSYDLLAEVARVLNNHADVRLVEVAGHTDGNGDADANRRLAQKRAEAVVQHLITYGAVAPERLEPRGYGEDAPLVPETGEDARAQNRRVEFNILEQ